MSELSIIVPIYNVEEYLNFCIDSILEQTYKDFKLILVDDGSTDKSGKICDEYAEKDSRVQVFHTENRGSAMARNYALDRVDTDYLAMIDSDDYIPPCYIEYLFNLIKKNDADIAYCLGNKFFIDSDVDKKAHFDLSEENITIYSQKQIINLLCSNYTTMLIVPMKMYKTSVFKGNRYPDVKKNDDEWLIHHLFLSSKRVVFSPSRLYFWRQRQTSQTLSFSLDNFSGVLAHIERKKSLKKSGYKIPIDFEHRFMRNTVEYFYNCLRSNLDCKEQINSIKKSLVISYIKIVADGIKRFFLRKKPLYDRNDYYTLFLFSFNIYKYPVDWDRVHRS